MRVLADDLADLALADGLDGGVDHEGLGDEAQDAPQADARAVEHGRGADDGDIDGKEGLPDLDVRVAAQDHGQDVRAASGGADVEDEGRAEGGQQHGEADVEREVARDGGADGKDELEERDVGGKRDGGVGAPEHGAALEEDEAQGHEGNVQHPHEGRDGKLWKERREHDGHARGAAKGQVVGGLEDDDGERGEKQTGVQHPEKGEALVAPRALIADGIGALTLLRGLVLADGGDGVALVGVAHVIAFDLCVLLAHCTPLFTPSSRAIA